jgi:hypothetical protein
LGDKLIQFPIGLLGFCGCVALLLLKHRSILSVINWAIWILASVILRGPSIFLPRRLPHLERECSMAMKYVMLRLDGGELLPVLFPEFMQHAHMAQSVPAAVVSAGRVHLENGKVIAGGASSSLNVSSCKEDSGIIQAYFEGQNVIQQEV